MNFSGVITVYYLL